MSEKFQKHTKTQGNKTMRRCANINQAHGLKVRHAVIMLFYVSGT